MKKSSSNALVGAIVLGVIAIIALGVSIDTFRQAKIGEGFVLFGIATVCGIGIYKNMKKL